MSRNNELKVYLYSLLRKYPLFYAMHVLIALSAALFGVLMSYQVKRIIDTIANNPAEPIMNLLWLFILYKLLYHGFHFFIRLFAIRYTPSMLAYIVEDAYTKVMNHSLHWFDSRLSGEVASKITDLQESILTINQLAYKSFERFFTIILALIFLFFINYTIVGVVIAFVIIYLVILVPLLKKQIAIQRECVQARQEVVGIINDSISNVFTIKIIGNMGTEFKRTLVPAVDAWKQWDKKTRMYDAYSVDMADTIVATVMGAIQIFLLAYLYQAGSITAGEFAFVIMITINIHKYLDDLLENILFYINPKIAVIQSCYQVINSASDVVDAPNAQILPSVQGDIRYEQVTFGYSDGPIILNDLTLHIKPGTRVGIVGTSGAGKTTLVKCLVRYFNVQAGRILIDGYDIAQVTQESLRAQISIIPQDVSLFHRSVIENLRVAKPDATFEEIQIACKKAKIHNEIMKMSHGYESIVGERGVKMSGGQRQRLAIARALLKNAPILILDEATSALDTPTELLIQESINEMLQTTRATTIVIAHRLSTLLTMDRILVFEHGTIVEEGTHQELLSRNGLYGSLWNAQVGGFLLDK